jgi:putative inorganic carbon (HCO3(-)) transporter
MTVTRPAATLSVGLVLLFSVAAAVWPTVGIAGIAAAIFLTLRKRPVILLAISSIAALVVRPLVDGQGVRGLGVGPIDASFPAAIGLVILVAPCILAAARVKAGLRLWPDRLVLRSHAWLFAAYGIGFVSATWNYGGMGAAYALRELVRVASLVASFLAIWWCADSGDGPRRLVWAILVGGAVLEVLVSVVQLATGHGLLHEITGLDRLQGTFSHPNTAGLYYGGLFILLLPWKSSRWPIETLLRWMMLCVCAVLLAYTYSRTSLLVLGIGIVVYFALRERYLTSSSILRVITLAGASCLMVWFVGGAYLRERFGDVLIGKDALVLAREGITTDSFAWRLLNWDTLVGLGFRHPIIGHGSGLTMLLNPIVNSDTGTPFNAHNDLVRFFFETGVLGLLCYMVYGALFLRWLMRTSRHGVGNKNRVVALAAIWASMFFLTAGTPELSLQTALLYLFYGLAAVTYAESERGERDEQPLLMVPETST